MQPDARSGQSPQLIDPNLRIRTETPADHEAIREIHNAAFGRPAEGKLVDLLRQNNDFSPEMSLVCVDATDTPVGHALLSNVQLDSDTGPIKAAALAPVAVHPDAQSKGIGSALTRQAIIQLRALGYEAALVLGEPAYYTRFGFSRDKAKHIRCPYQCEAFLAIELTKSALSSNEITATYPEAFTKADL